MIGGRAVGVLAAVILGISTIVSVATATRPCSGKVCSDEIAATCAGETGSTFGACKRKVLSDCRETTCTCDGTGVPCGSTMTTLPCGSTPPCTPGLPCGPCMDGFCIVDTEGQTVCTNSPCLGVGCTASSECQPCEVCDPAGGFCCPTCP